MEVKIIDITIYEPFLQILVFVLALMMFIVCVIEFEKIGLIYKLYFIDKYNFIITVQPHSFSHRQNNYEQPCYSKLFYQVFLIHHVSPDPPSLSYPLLFIHPHPIPSPQLFLYMQHL